MQYYLHEPGVTYRSIEDIFHGVSKNHVQRIVTAVKRKHGEGLRDDDTHIPLSRAIKQEMSLGGRRPRCGELWYTPTELKEGLFDHITGQLSQKEVEMKYGIAETTLKRHKREVLSSIGEEECDPEKVKTAINALQLRKPGKQPFLWKDEVRACP